MVETAENLFIGLRSALGLGQLLLPFVLFNII